MRTVAENIVPSTVEQAIEQAAREILARGYRVVFRPTNADIPALFAQHSPELAALQTSENVLVGVRFHAQLADPDLASLARAVAGQKGWRLDVVVPDQIHNGYDLPPSIPIAADVIDGFVSLSDEALQRGQIEAAAVLGWTAAEACPRLRAREHAIILDDASPSLLVRQLFAEGLLRLDAQRFFTALSKSGFADLNKKQVAHLLQIARLLFIDSSANKRK